MWREKKWPFGDIAVGKKYLLLSLFHVLFILLEVDAYDIVP